MPWGLCWVGVMLGLALAGCGETESGGKGMVSSIPHAGTPASDRDPVPPDGGTAGCPAEMAPGGDCVLTLETAIHSALERNVDLYNQRQSRKEQQLELEINTNLWRPKFSASTSSTTRAGTVTGSVTLTTTLKVPTGGNATLTLTQPLYGEDGESQSLSLSQPLFRGAGRAIALQPVRRARLTEQGNILGFRDSVAGLVDRVIAAYRGLSAAIRQVEISAESLERAREQSVATQALIEAGRVPARDAARAESAIANGELALERARNAEDRAQTALRDLLELDDMIRIRPVDVGALQARDLETVDPETVDPETVELETVLARRTDYQTAVIAVEQAKMALAKTENDHLPDINLNVTAPFGTDPSLGVSASFPLSDRKERHLARLQARNRLDQTEGALVTTRKNIQRELRQAVHDVAVNRRLADLARASRELAARNLEIEQIRFAQGLSSATDLTSAERELASATESEKEALVNRLNARDALDRVTGRTLERWGIAVDALEP